MSALAWLPHSIAEASLSGDPDRDDVDLSAAWSHLLQKLEAAAQIVDSDPVSRNRVDLASGMRHLLVLLAAGVDEVLRFDPDPILSVQRTSTDDLVTWGMECPDCLYTRATLRGGESYRLSGSRGTARYVGLQTMNGIASTANELVDELEIDPDGNFEVVLSAQERDGNWMRIEGAHPTLTVRHFFYDWDTEKPSSLRVERLGDRSRQRTPQSIGMSRCRANSSPSASSFTTTCSSFSSSGGRTAQRFMPPVDRTAIGAAAENRPVIGRWELGARRGADPRSRTARRRLLELLARQSSGGRRSTTDAISPA